MLEQYFFGVGLVALLLLVGLFLHAMVGDSLDPLTSEQIAQIRTLAAKYPSVNRMVSKWVARKKTLRRHHLAEAKYEADCIECGADYEREQRAVREQMSLLAAAATRKS